MHKDKSNYTFGCYAKVLFIIAIAFLVYGLILDYNNEHKLIDPVLHNRNKDIKITSIDVHNDKSKSNLETGESEISDTESRMEFYESIYENDEKNEKLRENLEKNYGIEIKYGQETFGYAVGGMDTFPITDSFAITSSLENLSRVLKLYPSGFFNEINDGGIPLTIYLIDEFSIDGVTGVTDSNNSFANIVIAIEYSFDETFFHESYHYIERFMLKKGVSFKSWNSFNPASFSYDKDQSNAIHEYSYNRNFKEDAYFVNDYAQTDASEDRASTFEYMMDTSKASCLNNGKNVWKKAKFICTSIESVFKSVSPSVTEYWERHL